MFDLLFSMVIGKPIHPVPHKKNLKKKEMEQQKQFFSFLSFFLFLFSFSFLFFFENKNNFFLLSNQSSS